MKEPQRRMPAEWEPCQAVLLTWPHQYMDWHDMVEIEHCYIEIVRTILSTSSVFIVCLDITHQQHITRVLQQSASQLHKCHFFYAKSNDCWIRDYGPISVWENVDTPLMLNFIFDGWGGKYSAKQDNAITDKLATQHCFATTKIIPIDFQLEGGSIESDGQNTLLVTSSCLLNPNRGRARKKEKINQDFKKWFGIERVLWLDHGALKGDDTDGHIDMLTRFANTTTLLYVQSTSKKDVNYDALQAMESTIKTWRQRDNKPYCLIPLPSPDISYSKYDTSRILPQTYTNFLIINDLVLVPQYQNTQDKEAIDTIQYAFPHLRVVGLDSAALIEQGGSVHCMTMNIPKHTS